MKTPTRGVSPLTSWRGLLFCEDLVESAEHFQSFIPRFDAFVAFRKKLPGEERVSVQDFMPEFQFLRCPIVEFCLRAFLFGGTFKHFGVAGVEFVDLCKVPRAFDDGFATCVTQEDTFDDGESFLAFKLEAFLTKARIQLMGGDPDAALEATEVLVAQGEPEIVPGFALRFGEVESDDPPLAVPFGVPQGVGVEAADCEEFSFLREGDCFFTNAFIK